MSRAFSALKHTWTVGLAALPFGVAAALLLWLFRDAIEASESMRDLITTSRWGGVELLFILNASLLGWATAALSERKLDTSQVGTFLLTLPWNLASIAVGLLLAHLCLSQLSEQMWLMLAYTLIAAIGSSAVRSYLGAVLS